jgi:hypothetical protein
MRKITFVLAAALLLSPLTADAQQNKSKGRSTSTRTVRITSKHDDCCWVNRFSLEPYAGALRDAYDSSPDDENTALLLGFRVGYSLSSRARLLGNVAYSESDNVIDPRGVGSYYIYDNTWVFTTGGAEFDVVPGRTSASIGLQGGVAWRRVDLDGTVGTPLTPSEEDDGFSSQEVVIPALMARHRITQRATFVVGIQDYIFDFLEGPARHSLAATAGLAFR